MSKGRASRETATYLGAALALSALSTQADAYRGPLTAPQGTIELVSISTTGVWANGDSRRPEISADGRYVVYTSEASNLVSSDTNNLDDVFFRDRNTSTTLCVSVNLNGKPGNKKSVNGSITADGRYVAFASTASDLVLGDTNGFGDIFIRDMQLGKTTRVSLGPNGVQTDEGVGLTSRTRVSSNGRWVTWDSKASNLTNQYVPPTYGQVYVRDLMTGVNYLVSRTPTGDLPWGFRTAKIARMRKDVRHAEKETTRVHPRAEGRRGPHGP